MSKKLLFLPILLVAVFTMAETKLTVIDLNGVEQQYALSQLGKITFENDVMYLYDETGTLLGFTDVENVGQVVVEEEQATALDNLNGQLCVFPNPTRDALIIKGLPENQTVRVYDLQGKLMMATPVQAERTMINVTGLQNGTYLLQAGAQIVKFIKE